MNLRQEKLQSIDKSHENIIIGNIKEIGYSIKDFHNHQSLEVLEVIESGLTGLVYHIVNKDHFNLKVKRKRSKVKNIDGQLAYLNEILCRKKIEEVRNFNNIIDRGVVKTRYANYKEGIILSDWIDGRSPDSLDLKWIEQVIELALELQKHGLFEWDLSKGNILIEHGKVKLFDFGYCYEFDPMNDYNSDGLKSKGFHPLERLETRYLMMLLLTLEDNENQGYLETYRRIKMIGIKYYEKYLYWLIKNSASLIVIDYYDGIIETWKTAINDIEELRKLYCIESYRAHLFDVYDDLSGQSCNEKTLTRVNALEKRLENHYDLLVDRGILSYEASIEEAKKEVDNLKEQVINLLRK